MVYTKHGLPKTKKACRCTGARIFVALCRTKCGSAGSSAMFIECHSACLSVDVLTCGKMKQ